MYRATLSWRWGAKRLRSLSKDEVAGSRTVEGVSDSPVMVHRRPL